MEKHPRNSEKHFQGSLRGGEMPRHRYKRVGEIPFYKSD